MVVDANHGALRPEKAGKGLDLHDGTHLTDRPQLDGATAQGVTVPVPGTAPQNLTDRPDGPSRIGEADVDEPGPGDDDVIDAVGAQKTRPQDLGDPLGRLPGRPRELKGDIGRVVPTPSGPRRRDTNPLRQSHHPQLPLIDGTTHRVQHGAGELDGGHGTSVGEEGGG
ncbi:hypothetical protein GCM10010415_72580 [Streptomyces atrovirens]